MTAEADQDVCCQIVLSPNRVELLRRAVDRSANVEIVDNLCYQMLEHVSTICTAAAHREERERGEGCAS